MRFCCSWPGRHAAAGQPRRAPDGEPAADGGAAGCAGGRTQERGGGRRAPGRRRPPHPVPAPAAGAHLPGRRRHGAPRGRRRGQRRRRGRRRRRWRPSAAHRPRRHPGPDLRAVRRRRPAGRRLHQLLRAGLPPPGRRRLLSGPIRWVVRALAMNMGEKISLGSFF